MLDDSIKIPSEEEIRQLPRRAMVAFAVRCARRVRPLFEAGWPEAPSEDRAAIDRAIAKAEDLEVTVDLAAQAARVARSAENSRAPAASDAAYAAAYAADSAYAAFAALDATAHAVRAAAIHAGGAVAKAGFGDVVKDFRRDFTLLEQSADREEWTEASPKAAAVLGPLWPDGEPAGWPGSS